MREVLLVDPLRRCVERYARTAGDEWRYSVTVRGDIELGSVGVKLSLDDIYEGLDFSASEGADEA